MKFLFLYMELAGYFHACLKKLVEVHHVKAKVFMWPINPNAPFSFESSAGIEILEKKAYDRQALFASCKDFQPDLIYVAGWVDTDYKYIARYFRKQEIPVICGMDNQWNGNLRQRILSLISRIYLKPYFSHIWVAGMYQYEYARKLGYARNNILMGLYCADFAPLNEAYHKSKAQKEDKYPYTLLYVGRLAKEKASMTLYQVFKELVKESKTSWKLIFVGTGLEYELMEEDENIELRGFIQPEKIPDLAAESGCFVLPSLYEPWGVAVHEFAAAGLPIITSDAVGATTAFVYHGYNGYIFSSGQKDALKNALRKIINHSDAELLQMGDRSAQLSHQITPESWAATLVSVVGS